MEISDIKASLKLQQVLEHYGLKPKNGMLNCPFHDDKTPSMQFFADSQSVRCYSGNCEHSNKLIDVIDFIMYKENLSKHEAILKAKEMTNLDLRSTNNQKSLIVNGQSLIENPKSTYKEYQELPMDKLEEVFYKMKSNLRQGVKDYLQSRSLDLEKLEIGYNGRTYKGVVNCIVFPLKNKEGKMVSLYGRSIKKEMSAGTPGHYYLKNRNGLYPSYPDKNTKILILTESIIDCASLLQNEKLKSIIPNLEFLACYGVNGLNEEILNSIKDLPQLEELIFCFDSDNAGQQSVLKYSEQFKMVNPKLKISSVELPNKDVNETLQLHKEEVFTTLLEERTELLLSVEKQKSETKIIEAKQTGISGSIDFLKQPNLLEELNKLIGRTGIVGEDKSRMLLFLIIISYQNKQPLHGIVQGSSGSGKTHLISKIADLMPQEDVLRFTRITESSLYNWGEYDLYQKIIIIEDLDGMP